MNLLNLHPEAIKTLIKEAILEALEEHEKRSHVLLLQRLKEQRISLMESSLSIAKSQTNSAYTCQTNSKEIIDYIN